MKFKAIEKICKDRKSAVIFDGAEQWLGDGVAAFVLRGAPMLDKRNVLMMFDVPEAKREDWYVNITDPPGNYCFENTDPGEQEVRYYGLGITNGGRELRLFDTPDGIAAIDEKYLAPVRDNAPYLRFFLRTTKMGVRYFAVKEGLLLVAVIMPYDIAYEDIADEVERLIKQVRKAMQAKAEEEREKENANNQIQIDEFMGQVLKGEDDGKTAH